MLRLRPCTRSRRRFKRHSLCPGVPSLERTLTVCSKITDCNLSLSQLACSVHHLWVSSLLESSLDCCPNSPQLHLVMGCLPRLPAQPLPYSSPPRTNPRVCPFSFQANYMLTESEQMGWKSPADDGLCPCHRLWQALRFRLFPMDHDGWLSYLCSWVTNNLWCSALAAC